MDGSIFLLLADYLSDWPTSQKNNMYIFMLTRIILMIYRADMKSGLLKKDMIHLKTPAAHYFQVCSDVPGYGSYSEMICNSQ